MKESEIDEFLDDLRVKLFDALKNGKKIKFDGALVFEIEEKTEMLSKVVGQIINIKIGETDEKRY